MSEVTRIDELRQSRRSRGSEFRSGTLEIAARGMTALVLLLASVTAVTAVEESGSSARVSLERIIDSTRLAKRSSKLLRWIVDQQAGIVMERPFAAVWDGDALLVTDPGAGRLLRIDERDRVRVSTTSALVTPVGIARCAAGILVTDSSTGEVLAFDEDLRLSGPVASGMQRPTGIACDGGRVIVAETGRHRLVVLDDLVGPPAEPLQIDESSPSWGRRGGGNGEMNFPTAVAIVGNSLWVGDTMNFRVQLLNGERGEFISTFGQNGDAPGEMPRIKGLAVDRAGHLWVSDAHLDQVALYRADGRFLFNVGGSGAEPGQFLFPAGIAAHPDGRVAIVDSLNRRIQVFKVSESGGDGAQ